MQRWGTFTCTTVVGALWTWETALRPAKGRTVDIEKGVLLLETEPGNMFLGLLHDLSGMVAVVGSVGSAVVVVGFGEDKDVVAAAERVLEDSGRAEIDIGVVSRGLISRGTIKVPDSELADIGDFLGNGLGERRSG